MTTRLRRPASCLFLVAMLATGAAACDDEKGTIPGGGGGSGSTDTGPGLRDTGILPPPVPDTGTDAATADTAAPDAGGDGGQATDAGGGTEVGEEAGADAGGDGGGIAPDGGQAGPDAGGEDSGGGDTSPGEDSGAPPEDSGIPPADGGGPAEDAGGPPPDDRVPEVEPNDTPETAQPLDLPVRIAAAIGEPGDRDAFTVALPAGTVIELAVEPEEGSQMDALVRVAHIDPDGATEFSRRVRDASSGGVWRELFLPYEGIYTIEVLDERAGAGGEDHGYTLTVREVAPVISDAELPLDASGVIERQGALAIWRIPTAEGGLLRAEVEAVRLAEGSGLDPILLLFDEAEGILLDENDDTFGLDPAVAAEVAGNGTYLLVLDHYSFDPERPLAYRVLAGLLPWSDEREPNDTVEEAAFLPIPSGEVYGTIGAPEQEWFGETPDTDVFRFTAAAGDFLTFRLRPGEAAATDPHLAVAFLGDFDLEVVAVNDDSGDPPAARLDFLVPADGEYFLLVRDARNLGAPPYVGGDDFNYVLTADEGEREVQDLGVLPAEVDGTVDPGGTCAWYSFRTEGSGLLAVEVSGFDAGTLTPVVSLYPADGPVPLTVGEGGFERFLVAGATDFLLSVCDAEGRGGPGQAFHLAATLAAASLVNEAEPNDTAASAQRLPDLVAGQDPIVVEGLLGENDGADLFRLRARGGQVLTLWLEPAAAAGEGGAAAPTLTLFTPGEGNALVPFDHAPGPDRPLVVPGTGKNGLLLFVRVEAEAPAAYRLVVVVEGCPDLEGAVLPSAETLVLNEIHADPADGAEGDANGDGLRDASQDEFLEFVNTGDVPLDLGGLRIRDGVANPADANGYDFACGTLLPPGKALLVFGGGRPTGWFGGALVVAVPGNDNLGLNNDFDTVKVTVRGGEVPFLEYRYQGENRDRSLTRVPDLVGDFAQHPGDARFSPGTAADGTPFGGPPEGDLCFVALPVEVAVDGGPVVVEGDTSGLAHDSQGSCTRAPGPDVTYVFTLEARADVTATVRGAEGFDTVLYLFGACALDPPPSLACNDDHGGYNVSRFQVRLDPGTYYVVVDGYGADDAGAFELTLEATTAPEVPANDACEGAIEIPAEGVQVVEGDTRNASNDFQGACGWSRSPDLVYSFTLDAPTHVSAFLEGRENEDGDRHDTVLYLRNACAPGQAAEGVELACNDDAEGGDGSWQSAIDADLEAGPYYLFVDGFGGSSAGPFLLTVTFGG